MEPTGSEEQLAVKEYTSYVAFLDVLGFRALVGSPDWRKKLETYIEAVDHATRSGGTDALQYVIFSDSVIINSKQDDYESFEFIVTACATLFAGFLESGIAVRGAIAHGKVRRSEKKNGTFVAGGPIIEAYGYESRQNWVGIMLCPSTTESLPDLEQRCALPLSEDITARFDLRRLRLPALIQQNPCIRFHKEDKGNLDEPDTFEGHAVLPTGAGIEAWNIVPKLDRALQSLERLKMIAPDPKAQKKYSHTLDWLGLAKRRWETMTTRLRSAELAP
jgi:hypothetical protein